MSNTLSNVVLLSDRRPATAIVQAGGYSADELTDVMSTHDLSAMDARIMIEAERTSDKSAGAIVLDFARRES